MNATLLFLIPLLPLAGAVVNMLFGLRLPRRLAEGVAVLGVAAACLITILMWGYADGAGTTVSLGSWLAAGSLQVPFALHFDQLAAPMTLMVTGVATLIHLYAVGYMHDEPDYPRFFGLLNLFVFAMLTIILADNLLLLFLGWEGVGLCSYGLIGFWYQKLDNARAGVKAFLVTRIGDVFLAAALLWLFALTGTLEIAAINARAAMLAPAALTGLTLLLLLGASGKSAQLPLMTWLADAMAGPTPVSALIHAATMVTAGVYLLCRLFPLVSLSPAGMAAIAVVGAATALYAATCALAQREIKRVLAYSTMSQVGYMFLAVGAGSVSAAMFHLLTHAFFKAALFMAAGCVIHLAGGENDLMRMGGVGRHAPRSLLPVFVAGALCLAGFPLTGGFFSKDAILLAVYSQGTPLFRGLLGIALLTALLTAFYTFRMVYLVFAGEPRNQAHPHHLPGLMGWPLWPLALTGLAGGLLNLPALLGGGSWLSDYYGVLGGRLVQADHAGEMALAGIATGLLLVGWAAAHWRYRRFRGPHDSAAGRFLLHGWGADALAGLLLVRPFAVLARCCAIGGDRAMIDGTLDGLARQATACGERLRLLTSGRISTYLNAFAWGFLLILGWLLLALIH